MDDTRNFHGSIIDIPLSIIDEKPELTTLVEATNMQSDDNASNLSNKILSKLSRGYTLFTVIKVISYTINETSLILPYCLIKLGIFPFFLFLILFSLLSIYIFYLMIDNVVKHNLFNNFHKIIEEKTNKCFILSYYIICIVYHVLILIFENYIFLSLCQNSLDYFQIKTEFVILEKILLILMSITLIDYPLSFFNYFEKPDILYIFITFFIVVFNITAIIFVVMNKSNDNITFNKINYFEKISKDYLTCFSIIIPLIGWQSQISNHLSDFKIKTSKRFHKVVYLFFIIQFFFITFICLASSTLLGGKEGDGVIYSLDYNKLNLNSLLIVEIMCIIFGLLIHFIIAYHIQSIKKYITLILKLTIYKKKGEDFEINRNFFIGTNLFFLLFSGIINVLIKDISIIIILYGGVFSGIVNFIFPIALYWSMVSKNSLVTWIGWFICLIFLSLGILGVVLC